MATQPEKAGPKPYVNVTLRISPELRTKLLHATAEQTTLRNTSVSMNALVSELCEIGLAELAKQQKRR
jgi:hypothetical protein